MYSSLTIFFTVFLSTAAVSTTIAAANRPSQCPDGSQPVQCFVNPCATARCSAYPNAVCRPSYCGGCNAQFYNPFTGGQVTCNNGPVTTTAAPGGSCPDGSSPFNCFVDPCQFATCPAFPNAVCRSNYCGGCNADFYNSGRKVTCNAPTAPGTCPGGGRPVQCFVDPCRSATCPAFPNAVCRANYCGGCNADFYNSGVKVDCSRGLPDNCPVLRCMACPAGQSHTKDARGCDTCACRPNGGTTPKPLCGPVCAIYCPNGNVLDANGCATCRCKPSPTLPTTRPTRTVCGPVCAIFCPNGNVLDANGCPTCRCKPAYVL